MARCAGAGFESTLDAGQRLTLELCYRPPLDVGALLAFLRQRAVPGVEEVVDGRYRRTVALPGGAAIVELVAAPHDDAILMRAWLDDPRDAALLRERCRHLLDLDADPTAIGAVLGADPALAPLVATRPGLRVPRAVDGFELAVRAILGQQVSVAGARTLAGRLAAALGTPLAPRSNALRCIPPSSGLTHLFPSSRALADADVQGLGITRARGAALRALARAVAEDDLALDPGADPTQTAERLLALPGIGPWTVSYIAMRGLGNPDAFPAGDLGLRRALERRGLAADPAGLAARAETWRPWRAYAVMHLWASL